MNLLSLTLTALPLFAQNGSLQGIVVNSVTGAPVKQANVQAAGPEGKTVLTDREGRFSFPNLKPGNYFLSPQHSLFPQPLSGVLKRPESFVVNAGETRKDVTVRLIPPGALSGRLVDMDGDPLRNCQVNVLTPSFQRGQRMLMQMNGTSTNDKGEYRIFQLAAGQYFVSARCLRPVAQPSPFRAAADRPEGTLAYATQYYPGAPDLSGAGPVPVSPGAEAEGIDFRLGMIPVFPISGRVTVPPDAPTLQVQVSLWHQHKDMQTLGPASGISVPPNAGGRWKLPVIPPGAYELRASGQSPTRQYSAKQAVIIRDAPVRDLVLELAPVPEVTGTVRIDGDVGPVPNIHINLVPHTAGPMTNGGYAQVKDGTFRMPNVMPGDYELMAQGSPPIYVKSAVLGGQAISPYRFTIYPSGGSLDLVVSSKMARVDGAVEGEGAMIILIPAGEAKSASALQRLGVTDASGRFSLTSVVPGEYKLAALSGVETNAFQNPAVLELVERSGESIRVGEGETVSKPLRSLSLPR